MTRLLIKLHLTLQRLLDENGQDLVEYALLVGLIGLGSTVGSQNVANALNQAFVKVGTKIAKNTT